MACIAPHLKGWHPTRALDLLADHGLGALAAAIFGALIIADVVGVTAGQVRRSRGQATAGTASFVTKSCSA